MWKGAISLIKVKMKDAGQTVTCKQLVMVVSALVEAIMVRTD